jgi:hypothetical protein
MKRKLRTLPGVEGRVETGAIQFGGDWPGLFIRGDDAMALFGNINEIKASLRALLKAHKISEEDLSVVVGALMPLVAIRKLIKDNVIQR